MKFKFQVGQQVEILPPQSPNSSADAWTGKRIFVAKVSNTHGQIDYGLSYEAGETEVDVWMHEQRVGLPSISRDAENVLLGSGPYASYCRASDELDRAGYTNPADGERSATGIAKIEDIKLSRQAEELNR